LKKGFNIMPLLQVNDLKIEFASRRGIVRAVKGIDFSVKHGEIVAVVGESGCGKTVTALSILRLLGYENEKSVNVEGEILFKRNKNTTLSILDLSKKDMISIRGKDISMIFQEPMTSLNPIMTIGYQIAEVIYRHNIMTKKEAFLKAEKLMEMVGIPDAKTRINSFPHQLSGGMRQRIMIAIAIACNPKLLIADEPTTALDVTIQAQILYLLKKIQSELGTSLLFITHNLGIVAQFADRVIVMYSGSIMESGPVKEIYHNPLHPYTKMLLKAVPLIGKKNVRKKRLESITGSVPDPTEIIKGCSFYPRCPYGKDFCKTSIPQKIKTENGHEVNCFYWKKIS
jgi:oligopeptide/dipeptide ABC transporter ATP-binding protein